MFYIYRWIRLDSNTPFYVGKGKKYRYKQINKSRNSYFKNIIKSVNCEVEIILDKLSEKEAFIKEQEFITLYKSLGYCEANFSNGGEGPSGFRQSKETLDKKLKYWTPEIRESLSLKMMGRKGPNKGRIFSQEIRKKNSENRKGKLMGKFNHKSRPIVDSMGNIFDTITSAAKFHKVGRTAISNILCGVCRKSKTGMTYSYLESVGG